MTRSVREEEEKERSVDVEAAMRGGQGHQGAGTGRTNAVSSARFRLDVDVGQRRCSLFPLARSLERDMVDSWRVRVRGRPQMAN